VDDTIGGFFPAANRLNISRTWLYFGIHFSGAIACGLPMWKSAPEFANQRASFKKGTHSWDKVNLTLYFLMVLLVTPIIAGLDGQLQAISKNKGKRAQTLIWVLLIHSPPRDQAC
jgi:hypothetical protein